MATGSSPLARGLPFRAVADGDPVRIIPARAGFTTFSVLNNGYLRDHPRSRGVYVSWPVWSPGAPGSSPLARGLHVPWDMGYRNVGIIPARAGFTSRDGRWGRAIGDHPRSRGVYARVVVKITPRGGSSPLARGLRNRSPTPSTRSADHPRSRGVYSLTRYRPLYNEGSSPLARGLRTSAPCCHRTPRIIPARAGFTHDRFLSAGSSGDHPRSRGVYRVLSTILIAPQGSSPLARGLRVSQWAFVKIERIIPARAGFTPVDNPGDFGHEDHPRSRGVYHKLSLN